MRRCVIALVAIFAMALAAVGGGALGRSVRPAGPGSSVRAAVTHAGRQAAVPVWLGTRLDSRLRALRDVLPGLFRPRPLPRQALSAPQRMPAPTTCAVGVGRCSLHPCVEFAILTLPQVTVATSRATVPQVTASPSPRVSRCRSVPATGQTRLLRVALTR